MVGLLSCFYTLVTEFFDLFITSAVSYMNKQYNFMNEIVNKIVLLHLRNMVNLLSGFYTSVTEFIDLFKRSAVSHINKQSPTFMNFISDIHTCTVMCNLNWLFHRSKWCNFPCGCT